MMAFSERKVSQMAAYFLEKRGGRMSHLKLIKLLYLSDRESMNRYGWPITGDHIVAMPHGPVLSMTLNYMDGNIESSKGGWESYISAKSNHEVTLRREVHTKDLDELSNAEIEVLDSVWQQFGKMSRWQLRDYTHEHCPEWKDPDGSSIPIDFKDVLIALGKTEDEARDMSAAIEEQKKIDRIFAAA